MTSLFSEDELLCPLAVDESYGVLYGKIWALFGLNGRAQLGVVIYPKLLVSLHAQFSDSL